MFRNYIAAAFGNLGRNWLYAGITILGLSVSFAAAILIGLYLRDELTFERFLPGHERAYRLESDVTLPGQAPGHMIFTNAEAAGFLRLDFPEVEYAARISGWRAVLKQGDVATVQPMVWADPDFFKVMPYPVLAGDANAALQSPDGLVITRSMARKYFGQDEPLGRTILVNPSTADDPALARQFHPMRVMAVLKDIPSNTHLAVQVFASARSPYSPISADDAHPTTYNNDDLTYLKLRPGVTAATLAARLSAFGRRRYPPKSAAAPVFHFRLMPVKDIHFADLGMGPPDVLRPSTDRRVDVGVAAVGLLIVAIAAINFVTLMTARATRRAVEVGVRKAVGASRGDLIVQFMGEALIYMLIALVLAVALAELALPQVNAFLQRTLTFGYLSETTLAAVLVAAALLTAFLAGLYPSLALSAFRPAAVLKAGQAQPPGSAAVRQALVMAQFAILIGLGIVTATIYRQTQFALTDALRLDTSQVAWLLTPCRSAFAEEAARLPGVKAKSCASADALSMAENQVPVFMPDRSRRAVDRAEVDVGYLELQGLKPLAGRFFSRSRGEDEVLDRAGPGADVQPTVVLNQSAARLLGFAHPEDAVGRTITWARPSPAPLSAAGLPARSSEVIGVVSDFTLASIRSRIAPQIYYVDPAASQFAVFRLDGRRLPETLHAMRRLWRRTGHARAPDIVFESQWMQATYHDVITQGVAIAVCSGLAIVIACLGLFALAAFTIERKTKEIGVRKAMGAGSFDILKLLLWQFTQPVLWANLIAWPVAFWAMNRWLHGFAYRVDLPAWLFLAAAGTAVLIAWATVSTHAWLVARSKPAMALRYE